MLAQVRPMHVSPNMIARHELPEDAADWHTVQIAFERLSDDRSLSCPESDDEIFEYVKLESADYDATERSRLKFLRTAQVAEVKYWLWEYTEEDGQLDYVVFRLTPNGSSMLSLMEPNGLSAEQFLLADSFDEIYWS